MKGSSDPSTGASLHGLECFHGAVEAAILIVPQLSTIHSDWKDARTIQKLFVFGAESADRVSQGYHGLHCDEGLSGILSRMLLEGEQLIKKETQIPPVGIGAEW